MPNSLDQKVRKLYAARSKREAELHAIHEDILHCINSQSRQVKVESLVTKCNEAFLTVVDKNEDLIAFAGKTEVPSALVPSLESYLEAMTTKNDKIHTSAQNYFNSADDKVSEFQEARAPILSRLHSIMTSLKYLVSVNMITYLVKESAKKLKNKMRQPFALLNRKSKWN